MVRITRQMHDSASSLHDGVERTLPAVVGLEPKAADRHIDDVRIDGTQRGVAQPHRLQRAGSQVFHPDVGLFGELQDKFPSLRVRRLDYNASLAGIVDM